MDSRSTRPTEVGARFGFRTFVGYNVSSSMSARKPFVKTKKKNKKEKTSEKKEKDPKKEFKLDPNKFLKPNDYPIDDNNEYALHDRKTGVTIDNRICKNCKKPRDQHK